MPDVKISAGADPVTLVATDKVPMARSASTTAYAATMAELASFANTAYVPNYFTGTPSMDATGAPGTAAFVSRGDHVHPSDTTRVAKAGDTMAGFLTLNAAPTATLHAATKGYVDGSSPVGGPYLPLVGGTLTGALTPAQPAGLVGTTTNNNASVGSVGEYISAAASVTSLTNSTFTNLTTLSLTAGDWDVSGNIGFTGITTTGTNAQGGVSTTSATMPPTQLGTFVLAGWSVASGVIFPTGSVRMSLAATTTVYLVCFLSFTGSASGFGTIQARRMR